MSGPSRRRVLSGLATVGSGGLGALSGCLGGTPTEAADAWVELTTAEPPGAVFEGRAELTPGRYAAVPLRWPKDVGAVRVSGHVAERLSLPVDVYTFTREGFTAYREGREADGLSSLSSLGSPSAHFRSTRLPHGEYALVVDNTRFGAEPGYDEISVHVSLTIEY